MALNDLVEKAKNRLTQLKEAAGEKFNESVEKLKKEGGTIGYKAGGTASFFMLKSYGDACVKAQDLNVAAKSYRMAMKTALELNDEQKFLQAYVQFNTKCKTAGPFLEYKQEMKAAFNDKFDKDLESVLE